MPPSKRFTNSALLHSLGVVAYVALVSLVIRNGDTLFGQMDDLLGPIAFLLLFTVSAGIVGLLVFGKPLVWFLNGRKAEAISLALTTVGFLFLETIMALVILALTR